MNIAIYTLTSPLHDAEAIAAETKAFLDQLSITDYELITDNEFKDYGTHALDLIYVRTGGTEGIFKTILPNLKQATHRPYYLLTSGLSNSLAASLEILSYLKINGLRGEILHGQPDFILRRINLLAQAGEARRKLDGCRLGVIGRPSDWLIASRANRVVIKDILGIEFVDIEINELIDEIGIVNDEDIPNVFFKKATSAEVKESLGGAYRIYLALKNIISRYNLNGFTLRCFDLLPTVHNTGCLALAKLNSEGIIAGCEGDIPALLSMTIANALLGVSGFQANPSKLNPESGQMLFAHCTIPLNMVKRYEFDTHFESGIGVGVRGYMQEGPVTIFKVAGDLSRHFAQEGMLIRSQSRPGLCRTQQIIQLREREHIKYFLTDPIGNHHIILPSHCKRLLDEILS
ncbi:MAG: hypothetical protein J6S96_09940 [Muribaculaceae bacterium]|nr:hypothetical protein [Muribaculaceae bacterium]